MITLQETLRRATSQLNAHPDLRATALPDAVVLLMHTLGINRATLIAHPERTVDRDTLAAYQRLIERRLRFEPVQYILGEVEFHGLPFKVTPAVLIPRPETEFLVEAVVARVSRQVPLQIADVGTGSGAIAIALAHSLDAYVTAIDLSSEALQVARENARVNGVADRIRFVEGDLFNATDDDERYDVIVSNPPYVPNADAGTLHPQVRDYEPALALFAGADGLDIYRRLIPQAQARLKPGGLLALEIGHGQRDSVAELLARWADVEFVEDLQEIPRVALARRV